MKISINKTSVNSMFPLTKGKHFLPFMYYTIKLVYVVVPSIVFENFGDILRTTFRIYFKCGSTNFYKNWEQRAM